MDDMYVWSKVVHMYSPCPFVEGDSRFASTVLVCLEKLILLGKRQACPAFCSPRSLALPPLPSPRPFFIYAQKAPHYQSIYHLYSLLANGETISFPTKFSPDSLLGS